MDHSILSTLDLVIIGVYLVAMVSIGLYFVRRIKGSEDYYVAGRSFGPLILMATVCATIIGGSGLMGRAGKAYSFGTMAITTALPYLIGMFIFSGISGRISRMGTRYDITSMPELFEKRFGKTASVDLIPFLETLLGHLWVLGQEERIDQLMAVAVQVNEASALHLFDEESVAVDAVIYIYPHRHESTDESRMPERKP